MTQKKNLLTTLFALALSLAFIGCSDDPQPAFEYRSQGFIKGTLTGTTNDNSYTFNEDFRFTQYTTAFSGDDIEAATYVVNDGGSYSVSIVRSDYDGSGYARISFLLDNASDKTPSNINIDFSYTIEESNKFIVFYIDSDVDNTTTIPEADFSFDAITGKVKGKFTLEGSDNSTEKSAKVTGEFDVVAKKIVQ
jgi:hypothetical protein